MALLYNFGIRIYFALIFLASFFNPKAKLWIKGRKNIFKNILEIIPKNEEIVWFHSASLGEFEQGRSIIENFKKENPNYKILLTFFSPSGYEIRKNYPGADYIFYLPIDTKRNAKKFIDIINPKLVYFIKYEFWFNYINQLYRKQIPTFIVSANFRNDQHFFKWYGGWFRNQLQKITYFFVQNEKSKSLLNTIGIQNVIVSGDTRFDRVYEITKEEKSFPLIEKFCENKNILIAGSTWPEDEEILLKHFVSHSNDYKLIIAPHEVHSERIEALIKSSSESMQRFSGLNESNALESHILIIDSIGILSHLYKYGNISFIGGGFGKGIHNILEAATFGLPIIFGPSYEKFQEAKDLIELKGAVSISNFEEYSCALNNFLIPEKMEIAGNISKKYVADKVGATKMILEETKKFL
ncbi:MAG: 3-deoxy-D-manno-octulosonic acid transferase [Bacteroidetes bacterium]|nr:3-deoxy-D-manno-octulosonic acid transferase [Bacteroidota bacterium]